MIQSIPQTERIFIEGDFNGQIGREKISHGSFGYGERNERGTVSLDFVMAYELMVTNSYFKIRKNIW